MGNSTVIRDVNETLKKLIRKNVPDLNSEDSVIFDSPADVPASQTAKLAVFLYRIVENTSLRNTPPESIGSTQIKWPPLALDLNYLFVPFAQNKETELIIMERLMQTFFDYSVLKGDVLHANLSKSGNTEIKIVSNNLTLDDLNKLWSTFQNKSFQLSTAYMLSPVRIPTAKPPRDITLVTKKEIKYYSMERADEIS